MKRRKFIHTSYGFMATLVTPGVWNIKNPPYELRKFDIKLIDLGSEEVHIIAKMNSSEKRNLKNPALQLDGYATWGRHYKKLAFQAAPEGKRQVFVADLSNIV